MKTIEFTIELNALTNTCKSLSRQPQAGVINPGILQRGLLSPANGADGTRRVDDAVRILLQSMQELEQA
ncbi:MAG TPA: hypothetical protein V6D17_00495 [Candidatus Obscuribacterales bacterium]